MHCTRSLAKPHQVERAERPDSSPTKNQLCDLKQITDPLWASVSSRTGRTRRPEASSPRSAFGAPGSQSPKRPHSASHTGAAQVEVAPSVMGRITSTEGGLERRGAGTPPPSLLPRGSPASSLPTWEIPRPRFSPTCSSSKPGAGWLKFGAAAQPPRRDQAPPRAPKAGPAAGEARGSPPGPSPWAAPGPGCSPCAPRSG